MLSIPRALFNHLRRHRKWWITCLVAVFLASALIAGLLLLDYRHAKSAFEEQVHAWQRQAELLSATNARSHSAIPDDKNAATLYIRAAALIKSVKPPLVTAQDPPDVSILDDLKEWRTMEDLVAKASSLDECRWPAKYVLSVGELSFAHPSTGGATRLIVWLDYAARAYAASGNYEKANKLLEYGLILSGRIGQEPFAVPRLWELLYDVRLLRTYQRIYAVKNPPESKILELVAQRNYRQHVKNVWLLDDAVYEINECRNGSPDLIAHLGGRVRFLPRIVRSSLRYRAVAGYLEIVLENVAQYDKPNYMTVLEIPNSSLARDYWDSQSLLSLMKTKSKKTAAAEAMVRLALLAQELRAYKAVHGSYPLEWDTPLDPFDGKPIGYRRENRGFVLSSRARDWRFGREIIWVWDCPPLEEQYTEWEGW